MGKRKKTGPRPQGLGKTFSIRLFKGDDRRLSAAAKREGLSRSAFIRSVLCGALGEKAAV